MRRKNLILIIVLIFAFSGLRSQTGTDKTKISLAYPVYSQYLHNGLIINPAYAGSREVLSLFFSGRLQWIGLKGAPLSQTVSVHSLLKNDRVGLGLTAQFMQYGFTKTSGVYANYAYHLKIGDGKLSLGLKTGFDMSNSNYSGITLIDPSDPVFTSNDKPYFLPNVGAGLYYYNKNYFAGFAVPGFLNYVKNSSGSISLNTFKDLDLLFTAGALIPLVTPLLKMKPSVYIDYSVQKTKKMQVDLNLNFIIADYVWIGGSWRTSENVGVGIIQLQMNPQCMFGVSYDFPLGNMSNYSKGSAEVALRYEFGYKVSAANPRYF
jgi:type IX secretion system PorP/SprF family membrane protein